jgi:hypothetical protein
MKSSEEIPHTVWRQEGKAVTIQMNSLMPDLTDVTKAKRF